MHYFYDLKSCRCGVDQLQRRLLATLKQRDTADSNFGPNRHLNLVSPIFKQGSDRIPKPQNCVRPDEAHLFGHMWTPKWTTHRNPKWTRFGDQNGAKIEPKMGSEKNPKRDLKKIQNVTQKKTKVRSKKIQKVAPFRDPNVRILLCSRKCGGALFGPKVCPILNPK